MTTHLPTLIVIALAFTVVEMSATALVARRLRNNGVVDVVWAFGFTPLIVLFLVGPSLLWPPLPTPLHALLMALMGLLWSLRLGAHLFVRVRAHHPREDIRYAKLREEWGPRTAKKMFWFFQLQGGLQVFLCLPFLLVGVLPHPASVPTMAWVGLALWILAWTGETLADRQLARFKGDPSNYGRVCREGLWRYSRHPNYFCEWLVWVAYACFPLAQPWGWLGCLSPALMFYFLRYVTGIPMTEELSVQSKGAAYRAYQSTTNAFWPWFPKAS